MNLPVKTACTHKGLIQNICPVCSGQYDNTTVGTKSVHLRKQLIQSVFPFVIGGKSGVLTSGTAYGINFINKNNTRGFFLGLAEEVPDPGCSHPHKHFNKIRSRDGEKRNIGLSGDRLCQ